MPLKFQLLFSAMVAIAIAMVVVPLVYRTGDEKSWPSALLAALAVYFGTTLAYGSLSTWHWPEGGAAVRAAPPAVQRAPVAADVAALQARTQADPEDVEAWALLGVAYLRAERTDQAVEALERAQTLSSGTSADITLALVDALVAQGDANRPRVNELIENLLFYAPNHPRALLYGAELAFSRGEHDKARQRWQVLLDRALADGGEQSRQVVEVLRGRIAMLDRDSAAAPPTAAPASQPASRAAPQSAAAAAGGVTVEVDIDPALRDRIAAGAPLFVLARPPGQGGPPLAVVRRSASEVPFEIVLSDRDAMLPSRVLSGFATVEIVARIASGGTPVAQSGDLFGAVTLERAGNDRVRVVISEVYP